MPKLKSSIKNPKTTSLDQLPDNVRFIMIATANVFRCSTSDLLATTRERYISDARHIAITIIHENYGSYGRGAGYTLKMIGYFFNRHHSTVMHAIEETNILCKQDDAIFQKYKEVYASAMILERRPSVANIANMYEDLNYENAIRVTKYMKHLLYKQDKSNVELCTNKQQHTQKELATT
jgi:hypothetical protein